MTAIMANMAGRNRNYFRSFNWADISGTGSGDNSGTTTTSKYTGNLQIISTSVGGAAGSLSCAPFINGVQQTSLICTNGASKTFFISEGQTLYFSGQYAGANIKGCTISVYDQANGNTLIDTFTMSFDNSV